jgi:molecular chaperone GrpE
VERERGETFQSQLGNLATKMLPALDNLNRAVDFALTLPDDHTAEFRQFIDGIVLVNQQMEEVFAAMGVRPISAVGEPFDPHFHEAVATDVAGEYPPNTVTGELLRGYRVGERVIRAAMVKVSTSTRSAQQNSAPRNASAASDDVLETE